MEQGVKSLERKAVKLALNQDWKKAVDLNKQILELDSKNVGAKVRLGRAFLQQRQFKDAQKLFEQVLKKDPINKIAKKNLELAKAGKVKGSNGNTDSKQYIKEPGIALEVVVLVDNTKVNLDNFTHGDELNLKINKKSVNVFKGSKLLGKITSLDPVAQLNCAKSKKAKLVTKFQSKKGNYIKILIRSDKSVFKAGRQEVRPYMKKGAIKEPKINMAATEQTN